MKNIPLPALPELRHEYGGHVGQTGVQAAHQPAGTVTISQRIRAHLSIARFDHVTKNVFILPGIAIPLGVDTQLASRALVRPLILSLIAASLIACSNYVINEILDAPFDRFHPTKRFRPVPSGLVNLPLAYAQWLVMMIAGLAVGWTVSTPFFRLVWGICGWIQSSLTVSAR